MNSFLRGHALSLVALLALSACGSNDATEAAVDRASAPIADHECDACGMILREQPAPRAELVHRDGERAFFCSIADLITYLAAPSPHGHPIAIYVEVMPDDATPENMSTDVMPLRLVEEVNFVYGDMHRPVMGEPVLTFATRAAAARAAERLHAQVTDFEGLKRALSHAE
jgi:copper chaperone NosL